MNYIYNKILEYIRKYIAHIFLFFFIGIVFISTVFIDWICTILYHFYKTTGLSDLQFLSTLFAGLLFIFIFFKFLKQIKKKIKSFYIIILLLFLFFICCFTYLLYDGYLQSEDLNLLIFIKNNHQIVQIIIALIGRAFVFLTLKLGFDKYNQIQEQIKINQQSELRRFRQTQKQINLTEENNINTTFKDAIILLSNKNITVSMGGVYTLMDIAKKNPKIKSCTFLNNSIKNCKLINNEFIDCTLTNEKVIQSILKKILYLIITFKIMNGLTKILYKTF